MRLIIATLLCSFSASVVFAEPPRHDSLKMRSIYRPSAPAANTSNTSQQPAPNAVDPASVDKAAKEAADVLQVCYSLARRSDPSLATTLTVQATVRADHSLVLRAPATALGAGYFARCVERKLSALVAVDQLPQPDEATRLIELGASK